VRRQRRSFRLLALILGFSLIAAACGGDDDDDDEGAGAAEEEAGEELPTGGDLILGAEQWPECLNPITQCSNASWLTWSVLHHVLPKLMEVDPEGNFVPTAVLEGEPELSGEGVDDSGEPFTITYQIAEDAVWSDNTPITSTDIRRTWEVRLATTGVVTTTGYDQIASIDDSDPKTLIIEWEVPYAAWQDVFGGGTEFFLKADELGESDDIADLFQSEIPFSGAPFILDSWSTEELTLLPNENYWNDERMPLVDSVTMIPLEDTETEITALRSGQVHGIFPQVTPGIVDELGDMEYEVGFGAAWEEIWFNQQSLLNPETPLQYPEVREAISYAIDRQQLLEEIVQPEIPETELLNCGGWVPTIGEWCDQSDFEDVTFDLQHAEDVLVEAGWEKGDDGIYARDGQRLSITWQTVAGNQRREDTQAIVIPVLQEFGIEVTADNSDAGTLFEQRLPQMQSEMIMYAWTGSPDPGVTTWAHCDSVPSEANEFAGQNNIGWCNEDASNLMTESDSTPVIEDRLPLIHEIGDLMREDFFSLPLWQLPTITAWDPAAVDGPIGLYGPTAQGGFGNLYDWAFIG
jgi:peptide/nickel transport system substrate-binding protein